MAEHYRIFDEMFPLSITVLSMIYIFARDPDKLPLRKRARMHARNLN